MINESRQISIEGSFNFRDIGGYQTKEGYSVKRGKLFRTANLSSLTENDLKAVTQLGIKNITDLRDEDEIKRYPSPPLTGAFSIHIPLVSDKSLIRQVES